MISCKNCGHSARYEGKICKKCGAEISFTDAELSEWLLLSQVELEV
jgi:uncharacterized OB-fold protein